MKKSVQLAIRASEIRSEINGLEPGEETIEKRRELLSQLNTVEAEYRTELATEAEAEASTPDANGLTAEERVFRTLETKAELRVAFRAVMNGSPLTGAEAELQEHRGLSGASLPWDLIAPRAAPRTEDRAVSPAPGDSHLQQHPILGRVFARSATMTLGVGMPMVATGEQNFPVITTTDSAEILAKDGAESTEADAAITAHVISPHRLQRSYLYRREDQAVLAGMEEALRADLSMAISDLLDAQVLAGAGTGANFAGFLATAANGGIANRSDSPARLSFALAAAKWRAGSMASTPADFPNAPLWSATIRRVTWRANFRTTIPKVRSPTPTPSPNARWRALTFPPWPGCFKRAFLRAWALPARMRFAQFGMACS